MALFICGGVQADLTENQVMLLYNSQNDESSDIAAIYIDIHPNVIVCDLDITYTTTNFPNCGITNRYITPCKFKEIFIDGPNAFLTCLAQNPQILAIATTRGLPAAISDTLQVFTEDIPGAPQPAGGIYASFEASLSRLGLSDLGQGDLEFAYDHVDNPYRTVVYPYQAPTFSDFLDASCVDENSVCPGDMFLVSRLDSHTGNADYDGDGDTDNVDGVYRMLYGTSLSIINKYATTAVFDKSPANGNSPPYGVNLNAAIALWNEDYCYFYDESWDFVYGPGDPNLSQSSQGFGDEAGFDKWPILAMHTSGQHHGGQVGWTGDYIGYYNAHPLGVFLSGESYNGWWIHAAPNDYPANQGQVMEWISAGGGFTLGFIQEPGSWSLINPQILFKNFFVYGLSWGEAVTTSITNLGYYATPIGDPLATITAYNPDITGDRIVDYDDIDIVNEQMGQQGPNLPGDVDGNGIVEVADMLLVREAYGRNATEPPSEPYPGIGCGDMNDDGWVDIVDLDLFYELITDPYGQVNPFPIPCPLLDCHQCPCVGDFNGDAIIDEADLVMITSNMDRYLFDLDGNGCFDGNDINVLFNSWGCPGDPIADLNCDGCVDTIDFLMIQVHPGNPHCNP